MAWVPLTLSPKTPPVVRKFLVDKVEMWLHDVHTMLRLPVGRASGHGLEEGLEAGCNLAATGWLLAIVSGVSTLIYPFESGSGVRFVGLLANHYPWEAGIRAKSVEANELYVLFRNPLAHDLGVRKKVVGKQGAQSFVRTQPRTSLYVDKEPLAEEVIERIERSQSRPAEAAVTVYRSRGKRKLSVPGLYWGVRTMIQDLTYDRSAMASAATFLSS